MPKKKIHLVCNAHLDPVWLWPWEDGLTEAISTFRVAADFGEKHPAFVFCHNESLLYAWIEKHEPGLFKRIQELVKMGRWHIAGGAYLQPDVNNTSGESHIRHYLHGLGYFKEAFNVRPTTAYNFDPFGHAEGFAQILRGCGMDSYIFCRPDFGTFDLPVGAFRWRDRSGSEVITRRSDDHYLTNGRIREVLDRFLPHFADEPETMILWGIGNHGGGVSRAEYRELQAYIREHPEYEFVQSTPEAFFAGVKPRRRSLPVVAHELQESFAGCYTSLSRVKRAHREAESLAASTERLAALAWRAGDAPYPAKELDVAWKDILFAEFHDILPGSGVPDVEKDSLQCLAHAKDLLRRARYTCLAAVLAGEKPGREGEVPIFIVNPHGFRVRTTAEIEYHPSSMFPGRDREIRLRHDGRRVPYQKIQPQHKLGDWRVRLAVPVDLAPFEIARLDASCVERPREGPPRRPRVSASGLTHRTRHFTLKINPRAGLVESLVLKGERRSLVRPGAFRPVLFKDLDHSWTCGDPDQMERSSCGSQAPAWRRPSARFRLATKQEVAALSPLPRDKWTPVETTTAEPIRIVEDGELRRVVEAVFTCGSSSIVRNYIIDKRHGAFFIRDRIFYGHRDHMLKLDVPLEFEPHDGVSEALYSAVTREPTAKHEERTNQRWAAVRRADGGYLAVCNTGSFGHSLTRRNWCLNVMRSPAYASFSIAPGDPWNDDRFIPRQDQGEHEVVYELLAGKRFKERTVSQCAQVLNIPPYFQTYFPLPGRKRRSALMTRGAPIECAPDNVQIVALKKAERGNGLVVRLQELDGKDTEAKLHIKGMRNTVTTAAPPFGLKTLIITGRGNRAKARKTNLVEGL